MTRKKVVTIGLLTIFEILISIWGAYIIHQYMYWIMHIEKQVTPNIDYSYLNSISAFIQYPECKLWFFLLQLLYVTLIVWILIRPQAKIADVKTQKITDKIEIPIAAGTGQHGSERFTTVAEKDECFAMFTYSGTEHLKKPGVVVEMTKTGNIENIRYVDGPKSTIIIGATRSGKTRRVLLETLWLQLMAGYSTVISDVKGEIYYYTSKWAESIGYTIIPFDLRSPKKSIHYNFLQPIINALKEGDRAQAIDYAWDLVSVLVGEQKGEPLWYNGETATLAAAILAVCIEGTTEEFRAQTQELTDIYYEEIKGGIPNDESEGLRTEERKQIDELYWAMQSDLLCGYVTPYIEELQNRESNSGLIEQLHELSKTDNSIYKNMTNVYYFLAYMGREDPSTGKTPLSLYLDTLPDSHPAKIVFMQGQIAAERTRSSFYTSALGTLKLFTNPNIAEMTSKSDFELQDIGKRKTVVYLIIPDEKKTFYPLASIMIQQIYVEQVKVANQYGGKLPVPCDYDLDEVGNFPIIPVLPPMITAGQSRGVRVNLIIQDYQQIEKKYKDDYETIKSNCAVKIYLKSDSPKTLKEISEYLGKYTVEVTSASANASLNKVQEGSVSNSSNLGGRELLMPAEIAHITAPYALVMNQGTYSSITKLPDLSQYKVNQLWGLGDEAHNTKIIAARESERPERKNIASVPLWGIWTTFKQKLEDEAAENSTMSFLGG